MGIKIVRCVQIRQNTKREEATILAFFSVVASSSNLSTLFDGAKVVKNIDVGCRIKVKMY